MKVHDETRVPEFLNMLKELSTTHIEIGIFGDGKGGEQHKKGDPITVLGIATVHEFGLAIDLGRDGSIVIPERSYLRSTFDNEKSNIINKCDKLLEKVISLELSVDVFFQVIGEYMVGLVQTTLTDLRDPPLSQSTIDQKGSSNPLIDTGRLRDSITYKVVRN